MVVVGGGFGGLLATRGLKRAPVEVTLVDRQNYHLFQPLAYQVATGGLAPAEIAVPLRSVLKRQANANVVLAEVVDFDLAARKVVVADLPNGERRRLLPYDTLVVAGGSRYSYFGHDGWAGYAPELKSLDGALEIRSRILLAFEAAEVELDPGRRRKWLTFVVVGAGPTGVEMAGQVAEIARHTLRREFRAIHPETARVCLVEFQDRAAVIQGGAEIDAQLLDDVTPHFRDSHLQHHLIAAANDDAVDDLVSASHQSCRDIARLLGFNRTGYRAG